MNRRRRPHPFTILLLCAVALSARAEFYKCTDGGGQTHYADRPAAGQSCLRIGPAGSARQDQEAESARQALADRLSQSQQRRQKAEADTARQKKEQEAQRQKEAACRQANERVAVLRQGGRVARINARGERYFLDDGQLQAELAAAQQRVNELCR